MARQINRLTDKAVQAKKSKKTAGLHHDGGGLYLQIGAGGAASWLYRFKRGGKARDMGLGSVADVTLAQARDKAHEARKLHKAGIDPIEARNAQADLQRRAEVRSTSFRDCAEQMIASHEQGWRNAKHRAQWRTTLATYAFPVLGDVPVADINTDLVLKVVQPIWSSKTATASRVRGRIEKVLSWAKARNLRSGENPAGWRGHLDQLLPARSKVQPVNHHPALPYRDQPAFMARLRSKEGVTPRALEFVILCASRTGEGLRARFDEMDLEAGVWTVPAERMKSRREHRVPLCQRAVAIVKEMAAVAINEYVFAGTKRGRPLSDMTLLVLLRELHPGITTHGFRSSFRDWAGETTSFPREVIEMALAHRLRDKTEAAYARGDLFEKRRGLMTAWGDFCESAPRPKAQRAQPARELRVS
jgi:integrase